MRVVGIVLHEAPFSGNIFKQVALRTHGSSIFRYGSEIDLLTADRKVVVVLWVVLNALVKMFTLPFLFTVFSMKQNKLNKTVVSSTIYQSHA